MELIDLSHGKMGLSAKCHRIFDNVGPVKLS